MKSKLDVFIKENRKAFDENELPDALWHRIEAELDKKPKKSVRMFVWLSVAASVIIVCGILWTFETIKRPAMEIADLNPEYAQQQVHIAGLIQVKKDSLETFAVSDPKLYQTFSQDLNILDEAYQKLKKDLPASPNQQFIMRAMVKNREMQLKILNQQLQVINHVAQFKNESSL